MFLRSVCSAFCTRNRPLAGLLGVPRLRPHVTCGNLSGRAEGTRKPPACFPTMVFLGHIPGLGFVLTGYVQLVSPGACVCFQNGWTTGEGGSSQVSGFPPRPPQCCPPSVVNWGWGAVGRKACLGVGCVVLRPHVHRFLLEASCSCLSPAFLFLSSPWTLLLSFSNIDSPYELSHFFTIGSSCP